MIDAYEIGITLALQDGVSAGLAAVRRDLGALDTAIAATAQGLARLQAAAGGAVAASEAELYRVAAAMVRPGVVTRPQAAPAEPAAAPAAAAARVLEREVAAPVRATAAPAAPSSERAAPPGHAAAPLLPAAAPTAVPVAATPVSVAPMPAEVPGSAAASRPAVTPDMRVTVLAPAVSLPPPVAPGVMAAAPLPRPAAAPVTVSVLPQSSASRAPGQRPVLERRVTAAPAAPELAAFARTMVPARMAQATTSRETRREVVRHLPESAHGRTAALPAHAASRSVPRPWAAAPVAQLVPGMAAPAAAMTATPLRQTAEQVGQQVAAGPTHGDVYLDGQLMGRWMADRMTRDADRPPSGPTGFDTRRSPAWPGAAVGP